MDNERDKPQGGPRPPGLGKIGVVPPQATHHPTTGLTRVIKKTPALEVTFWFVISTSVEVDVLQLFVIVLCFVFCVCFVSVYNVQTVVEKCHKYIGLHG